jgi:hypothetical protein
MFSTSCASTQYCVEPSLLRVYEYPLIPSNASSALSITLMFDLSLASEDVMIDAALIVPTTSNVYVGLEVRIPTLPLPT